MKKENKKLAQQQRARERQKRERIRKVKVFLKYFIPCAAVAALIFAIVFDTVQRSKEEAAQAEAESTESESSDDTEFSTDSTLTVQDGDTVNIDYVGTVDGVEFDGGSTDGNGADLVIGSGTYIDDFEEQLIGSHPGDQVSVEVTFPDNYSSEELSGKDAGLKSRSTEFISKAKRSPFTGFLRRRILMRRHIVCASSFIFPNRDEIHSAGQWTPGCCPDLSP